MAKVKTHRWDAAEYLETEEDMAAYLEAALEDGNPQLIAAALGDIARARGMSKMARDTGLGRESLYKALSPDGNPEFATVLNVGKRYASFLRHERSVAKRAVAIQVHAQPSAQSQIQDCHRGKALCTNFLFPALYHAPFSTCRAHVQYHPTLQQSVGDCRPPKRPPGRRPYLPQFQDIQPHPNDGF